MMRRVHLRRFNAVDTTQRPASRGTQPSVWVLILMWNGLADTLECLDSLRLSNYINRRVLLVDNGSSDGTVAAFRERFPEVHVLENGSNLGYAEGNNVGIRYALAEGADYILLLNNDTAVPPHMLSQLVDHAECDPQIGIVCPIMVSYFDRTKRYIATIDWKRGAAADEICPSRLAQCLDVEFASGCALLIKSSVVREIGLLDPAYFAYYEDVDWSLRCKKAGYRVVMITKASVYHKGTSDRTNSKPSSAWFYSTRNQRLFIKRHMGWRRQLPLVSMYTVDCLMHFRKAAWARDQIKASAILNGWWAGMVGRYGSQRVEIPPLVKWLIFRCMDAWRWRKTLLKGVGIH